MKIQRNKQGGFASIVGLIIVAAALIIGVMEWSSMMTQKRIKDNVDSFYNRIVYLTTQFHAFASVQYLSGTNINSSFIFPVNLSDLEGDYIPTCSEADNENGHCFKYNQTPWGEISDSDYQKYPMPNGINPSHWRAELIIKLPNKDDEALKFDREATLQLFAQMPNIVYDEPNNQIILRIERPDKAFAYDSLVERSGDDSTLLGDWDVGGNFAITNTKDVTIKNSNGTQTIVSDGLVNIFQAKHDAAIERPDCPKGKESIIHVMIGEVSTPKEHTSTGRIRAYLKSTSSTHWRVGLDNVVKRDRDGDVQINHTGYLTAITQCKTP